MSNIFQSKATWNIVLSKITTLNPKWAAYEVQKNILTQFSMKFVVNDSDNSKSELVQIMAWCQTYDGLVYRLIYMSACLKVCYECVIFFCTSYADCWGLAWLYKSSQSSLLSSHASHNNFHISSFQRFFCQPKKRHTYQQLTPYGQNSLSFQVFQIISVNPKDKKITIKCYTEQQIQGLYLTINNNFYSVSSICQETHIKALKHCYDNGHLVYHLPRKLGQVIYMTKTLQ